VRRSSYQALACAFVLLMHSLIAHHSPAADLQALTDEFDTSSSISRWLRLYEVEGWGANQLETWDINQTTDGAMRMMPYTSSWYAHLKGVLVHKNVTGDFIVTARLRVGSRADINQPPDRLYSLAGIFVRRPLPARTSARPEPMPAGFPAWPPGGTYETDWLPGQENYIFLSFGAAGNPGIRQYEVKSTRNSSSNLYFASRGVPASGEIELQFVMVGQTAVTLRRHPGGPWIVENRYTPGAATPTQRLPDYDADGNPETPNAYQVGITTYTDWDTINGTFITYANDDDDHSRQFRHNYTVLDNASGFSPQPDLVADVSYVRFTRPDPALTEAMLAALEVDHDRRFSTVEDWELAVLPETGAGEYLGDHADVPGGPLPEVWRTTQFAADPDAPEAQWQADFDGGGQSNLVEYALGRNPLSGADDTVPPTETGEGAARIRFTPDPSLSMHVSLFVDASEDLSSGSWDPIASKAAGVAEWTVVQAGATVEVDASGEVLVTDAVPVANANRRFLRLRAEIP
jgi:hypothetical protein